MNYLLDTCVISELVKPEPAHTVIEWVSDQDEHNLFLSVITIGEIEKGIHKLRQSKKKQALRSWLHNDLLKRFKDRIISIDTQVALNWGIIQASSEKGGVIIPSIDGLIAATAISHNMTIVSRNIQDMAASGASTLNPWRGEPSR